MGLSSHPSHSLARRCGAALLLMALMAAGSAANGEADNSGANSHACNAQNSLRKTLALTAFTRQQPQMANAGQLYGVESGLAEWLREALIAQQVQALAPQPQGINLRQDETLARRQAQMLARRLGVQFVLGGEIRDMSMVDANSLYQPGIAQRLDNALNDIYENRKRDPRARQFNLQLELRDGYTGAILLTRQYSTRGIWRLRGAPGFHSAAFAQSDYGQQLRQLMQDIGRDLAQSLACQPFIAAIDAAPGRTDVIIDSGANQGLRAGDHMELYQLLVVPSQSQYLGSETRLVRREGVLRLQEVYPSHSTAKLMNGQPLSGTFLAVSDKPLATSDKPQAAGR